ncbi:MAG: hypothetical protein V9G23_06960 [Giesbergeria sp.]
MVIYLPKVSDAMLEALQTAIHGAGQAVVYSWQPALLAQRADRPARFLRADSGVSGQPLRRAI